VEHKDANSEKLTQYLLGEMPEEEKQQLEEKYFSDDELYDELLAAERDLIDRYVQKELSRAEQERFEQYFLSAPGRRRKLRFAISLHEYVPEPAAKKTEEKIKVYKPAWWKFLLTPSYVSITALVIIAVGLSLGVWRIFFYESQTSKGLNALKQAYREQRPFEARISGFDYAPLPNTRGGKPSIDKKYQDLAEKLLLEATIEKPDAEAHHALGRLYLAKGEFDPAIAEFEEALKTRPASAQLHSDMGVALLEKANAASANEEQGKKLEALGKSLEHFNKAVELDAALLEALFNRALCYDSLLMLQPAKTDWQKYLEKDPNSKWADEARRRLSDIEEKEKSSRSKDWFQEFLTAHKLGQDQEAWNALSKSQSVNGNLIVEKLLDDYLTQTTKSPTDESLQALSYAADLTGKNTGDRYTQKISRLYNSASASQRAGLSEARQLIKSGHERLRQSKPDEAIEAYRKAGQLFERLGNDGEFRYAEYRMANAYLRQPNLNASLSILKRLAEHCKNENYQSLLARIFNSMADAYFSQNRYSEALDFSRQSLVLSEQVQDSSGQLWNTLQITQEYELVANYSESLKFLQRSLVLAGNSATDTALLRTVYGIAAGCFTSIGLYGAAVDYQKEAVRLAAKTANPLLESRSYARLAEVYGRMKNYDAAIQNARLSYEIGERLSSQSIGRDMMAFAALRLGHFYRQAGDFSKALESYQQNLELYNELNFPAESFAAHKGKFICHIAQKDDAAAEKEIEIALNLFEQFRSKITEESNRNTFFDQGQDIYDLAIDFAYTRLSDKQKAFAYLEASRSRSLLDAIHTGAQTIKEESPDLQLPQVTTPLALAEIQQRLPDKAQILQYAVLNDRLLIWAISKTDVSCAETKINSEQLNEKVTNYWQMVSHPSDDQETALHQAKDLYELLIHPVESFLDKSKYICIIPDKILSYIPFNTLVTTDSNRYLIQDYLLGYSSSSSVFIECCETARGKEKIDAERLLSVGNPRFDRTAFPDLRALPAAGKEARTIAGFYKNVRLLSDSEAKENLIKSEFANSDVVHLATHYVADDHSFMLSRLLLAKEPSGQIQSSDTDGFLQAWELYKIKPLHPRLVVLSACQTGIERSYKGEGAIGMVRPFIAAGVPLIIASMWMVDSDSTARLMINFHRHRKVDGLSSIEALRKAQLEMLNEPGGQFQQPCHWASFIITGGYTTF
jgi:CHAT domain-containing protein/cytochrome c-type biogenesis protein CcmH/NrfG